MGNHERWTYLGWGWFPKNIGRRTTRSLPEHEKTPKAHKTIPTKSPRHMDINSSDSYEQICDDINSKSARSDASNLRWVEHSGPVTPPDKHRRSGERIRVVLFSTAWRPPPYQTGLKHGETPRARIIYCLPKPTREVLPYLFSLFYSINSCIRGELD